MKLNELLKVLNAHVKYRITYRGSSEEVNLNSMSRAQQLRFKQETTIYMVFQEDEGLNICVFRNVNL